MTYGEDHSFLHQVVQEEAHIHRTLVQGTGLHDYHDIADRDKNCGLVVVALEAAAIAHLEAREVKYSYMRCEQEA